MYIIKLTNELKGGNVLAKTLYIENNYLRNVLYFTVLLKISFTFFYTIYTEFTEFTLKTFPIFSII